MPQTCEPNPWREAETSFDQVSYTLSRKNAHMRLSGSTEATRTVSSLFIQHRGETIEKADLELMEKIGHGWYGDVYCACWRGTIVAVKETRNAMDSRRKCNLLRKELSAMCNLNHPNLVQYFCTYGEQGRIGLIMDYLQMNLFEVIHIYKMKLSEQRHLHIIRQICSGMQYLHSANIPHCSLKSTNILLNDPEGKCEVKVTGYGLTLVQNEESATAEMMRYVTASRYSAPEILRGDLLTTTQMLKSDIYALALIVYSMVFSTEPFDKLDLSEIVMLVCQTGGHPEIPSKLPTGVLILPCFTTILQESWCYFPENRPSIAELSSSVINLKSIYSVNK